MGSFNGVKSFTFLLVATCALSGCLKRNLREVTSSNVDLTDTSSDLQAPVITSPAAVVYVSDASTLAISGTCASGATVYLSGSDAQSTTCSFSLFSFSVNVTRDDIYIYAVYQALGAATSPSAALVWNRLSNGIQPVDPATLACNPASSPFGAGIGTANSPYTICTATQLMAVSHFPSAYYLLVGDIDLSVGGPYTPIGWNSGYQFMGVFEGNGHTVSGFTYTDATSGSVGLFSRVISPGTIRNLNVTNVALTGNGNVGGVIGSHQGNWDDTLIVNTHVTGSITSSNTSNFFGAGGLVGNLQGAILDSDFSGTITGVTDLGGLAGRSDFFFIQNSHSNATITCATPACVGSIGGLIGLAKLGGSISDSYAAGSISAGGTYIGGLVGYVFGGTTINRSYSSATVSAATSDKVGGLVGGIGGSNGGGIILNSYTTSAASVSGNNYVGGLLGYGTKNAVISGSHALNNVTAAGNYAGGVVGAGGLGSIVADSYAGVSQASTVQGINYIGGVSGSMYDYVLGSASSHSVIINSYALSSVNGTQNVGGVTGSIAGLLANSYSTGTVTGAAVAGGLGGDQFVNGGSTNTGVTWNSAWDVTSSAQASCVSTGSDSSQCYPANITGISAVTWNRTPASMSGQGLTFEAQPVTTLNSGVTSWNSSWNRNVPIGANPISSSASAAISAPSTASVAALSATSTYTVTFAGADSVTFNDRDVKVTGSASATANVKHVSGSTYQVTLTNFTGSGSVGILLSAGTARDSTGALAPAVSSTSSISVSIATDYCGVGVTAFPGGTGTLANPYLICNTDQLGQIPNNARFSYKLISDIDLTGSSIIIGGTFLGTFDGSNKVLSNWTYTGGAGYGFFNAIGSGGAGLIQNLGLENVVITDGGGAVLGALVGKMGGGAILNSHVTGTMNTALQNPTGGLVGSAENGVIKNSYSTVTVTQTNTSGTSVGGLVGFVSGALIQDSFSTGNVTGCGKVGGFVGTAEGGGSTFIGDYVSGNVLDGNCGSTTAQMGGFIGFAASSAFLSSYATGTVTGNASTGLSNFAYGGFTGFGSFNYYSGVHATGNVRGRINSGGLLGQSNGDMVLRSYATGSLNLNPPTGYSSAQNIGGFAGQVSGGLFRDSYANGSASGFLAVGGFVGLNYNLHVLSSVATGAIKGTQYVGSMVGANYSGSYTYSAALGHNYAASGGFASYSPALQPGNDVMAPVWSWVTPAAVYTGCELNMTASATWDPTIWYLPTNGGLPTFR